jgi:hypothetical protein
LFEQLLDRDRRELAYMVDANNDLQIALKLSIETALQFIKGTLFDESISTWIRRCKFKQTYYQID